MSNGKPRWFGEEAQLRLIRWFGTREQVIGFTVAVGIYIVALGVIWFDPFGWHVNHFFRTAHALLGAFAIFAAIVLAPLMTYMTLESELLNRLLIMRAERAEELQKVQDAMILQLLKSSAQRSETMAQVVESLQEVLTAMQTYDRADAQDLDEVVAFIRQLGKDFPSQLQALIAELSRSQKGGAS